EGVGRGAAAAAQPRDGLQDRLDARREGLDEDDAASVQMVDVEALEAVRGADVVDERARADALHPLEHDVALMATELVEAAQLLVRADGDLHAPGAKGPAREPGSERPVVIESAALGGHEARPIAQPVPGGLQA